MKNTAQYSSWDAALYQPATGKNFCFPIRRLVSTKEVEVPPPKIASNFRVMISASDPAKGERSGMKNRMVRQIGRASDHTVLHTK